MSLHPALFVSAITVLRSYYLFYLSLSSLNKAKTTNRRMDSFKNRYTCERKEGRRFHERPTDLPLQFHFSPHANRNRIGQWTCLSAFNYTEVYLPCGIFSYLLSNRQRRYTGQSFCKNYSVYVR